MSIQQGRIDLGALRGTVCVVTGAANFGIGYGLCEVAASTVNFMLSGAS